ncbi:processed acidic surface protein [Bacillus sp. UMB0893]|uniref:processed acidic surface protein n=1 Tax=Bacillus sp. UMB0893 TaxID=2066053 RepID=UPI000C77FE50|nr:processed acidic surface protein [Bacillus sp. UMB0893]PLR69088.1 processed acidic surface protein [Bacillus sp. UMB0893]
MKRLLSLVLAVALLFGILPLSAFAIESNDPDFEMFLDEMNWDKQEYIEYLESKEWYLEDFESVDEMGTPLSEESVQSVMHDFEMSREELNELLIENGDIEDGQDVLDGTFIIFEEELSEFVDYYLNGWEGTPIDDENLQELLEYYEFETREELENFLNENDDSINNYEFIEDLDSAVDMYVNGGEYADEISSLFTELGLTEEELEKLFDHLMTVDVEDPAFEEKLINLSERMMAFEDFEAAEELTAEQIAELLHIFSEMLDLFKVETKYFLVVDGEKRPVSVETLMTLEAEKGTSLLMEIFNTQGDFLADILLTADMFGSNLIQETGKDIEQAKEIVTEAPKAADRSHAPVKTIKGGKLPDTAANYAGNTLAGLGLLLAGVVLFRRIRVKGI